MAEPTDDRISLTLNIPHLFDGKEFPIKISNLTTLVGPNGSGKTQVLTILKKEFQRIFNLNLNEKGNYERNRKIHIQNVDHFTRTIRDLENQIITNPDNPRLITQLNDAKRDLQTHQKNLDSTNKYLEECAIKERYSSKKIKFLSAGRMGIIEGSRADMTGKGHPNYDSISFASRTDIQYRLQAESISGEISTLSEKLDLFLKVRERLKTFYQRIFDIDWNEGRLKVNFRTTEPNSLDYPITLEASGLTQIMALLSVIYNNEIGILIIDEPEVSLHPQLQSYIRSEMELVTKNQSLSYSKTIIIATHSPSMILIKEPSDLADLIFFSDNITVPYQMDANLEEFRHLNLKRIIPYFNITYKSALFCKNPIIVEGISDKIVCETIASKINYSLGVGSIEIVHSTGKDSIPIIFKLLKFMQKTPIIITDLDFFTDGNKLNGLYHLNPRANELASEASHTGFETLTHTIYNQFDEMIKIHWDIIAERAQHHHYWTTHDPDKDEFVIKKRSALATLFLMDDSSLEDPKFQEWKNFRNSISNYFTILNRLGCFILKHGTIEDYYIETEGIHFDKKIEEALKECNKINNTDLTQIEKNYNEIIQAFHYAIGFPPLNEIEGILDLLSSITSMILRKLTPDMDEQAIIRFLQYTFKGQEKIFHYANLSNTATTSIKIDINSEIIHDDRFPIQFNAGEDINNKIRMQFG